MATTPIDPVVEAKALLASGPMKPYRETMAAQPKKWEAFLALVEGIRNYRIGDDKQEIADLLEAYKNAA